MPRKKLIHVDHGAEHLRNEVKGARERLFTLDREVTRLTAQLKRGRGRLWSLQQDQSVAEMSISTLIAGYAQELPSDALEEEKALEQEQQRLRQMLTESKAKAAKWFAEAKHQDGILQQERDAQKGGDAHRILAKHPAGEVFLPAYPSDNDSDDGYYNGGGTQSRMQQPAGRHNHSDSSDDDDDYDRARGPPGGRPPPAHEDSDKDRTPAPPQGRQYRITSMDDDSDGSSLPSPSGESGSMSGVLERSDEAAVNAMLPPSPANGPIVTKVASSSDSESADEVEAMPTAKQSNGTSVPTLPLAGSGAQVGVAGAVRDAVRDEEPEEVEEIYSDDIDEECETSRSC